MVDIHAERCCELLERLDGSFSLAGLELRDVGRRETGCLGQFLCRYAAMFAPDAKLVFAVDHSANNFRGDQLLLASRKEALDLADVARAGRGFWRLR